MPADYIVHDSQLKMALACLKFNIHYTYYKKTGKKRNINSL